MGFATIDGAKGGGVLNTVGLRLLQWKLATLSQSMQRKIARGAVRDGGKVQIKAVRANLPRSKKTGTSAKQSEGTQSKLLANAYNRLSEKKRGKLKAADIQRFKKQGRPDLFRTITQRPSSNWRKSSEAAAAGIVGTTIGAERPDGAHSHLVEFGHKLVAWGRRTNIVVKGTRPMTRAFESSKSSVQTAVQSGLRKGYQKEIARLRSKKK